MASLYNIENELLDLFEQIEDAGGEITEDQIELLEIKQDELKDKLESYYKAITIWESNGECCKNEKKRINDVQNKYKNRIERLKAFMLHAVKMFGEHGKTNMFIELPTVRLSTRASKSICEDENRVKLLISEADRYIRELSQAGVLCTGEDCDMTGILNAINANCLAEYGESFDFFTMDDLDTLKLSFTTTLSIKDLFNKRGDIVEHYAETTIDTFVENGTTKDDYKQAIKDNKDITIAYEENKESLIIK